MRTVLTASACTLLTLASLTLAMTAAAQDDAADADAAATADDIDREGERCISVSRLRSTYVVDDRTVLFYMRGGDIYRNVLRYDCPRLKLESSFSYRVIANRLCNVDTITVIERFGGSLSSGVSCGLGKFYGISEGEADFLRYGERGDVQEEPEPVELPEGESP
ncbi:MAG: hypothetical protein V3S94_02360 [Gammaproteobacteria bacterium]